MTRPEPLTIDEAPADQDGPSVGAVDGAADGVLDWNAGVSAREWTAIVLHHTATGQGSVESIHESHLARQWLGIGYHFVIGNGHGMSDGEIEPTFRWRQQLHGAHAGHDEYNQHGIGIVLVGNFDEQPPTDAQLAAVKRLVADLQKQYDIDPERIIGHGDVKATACPGRLFPLDEIRSELHAAASHAVSTAELKPLPDASPRSSRTLEGIDR
jgi:N-acetyl-anhydromuramyl-L-alanine amidase AmpD